MSSICNFYVSVYYFLFDVILLKLRRLNLERTFGNPESDKFHYFKNDNSNKAES